MRLFVLISFICCYAYKSHTFLGFIADEYLSTNEPIIYNKITTQLNGQTIASVSTWADKVKQKQQWSKKLHYIDILECNKDNYTDKIVDKYCGKGCIVNTIIDYTLQVKQLNNLLIIQDNSYKPKEPPTNEEKLKFLIHFIQDFNQPMHLLGYDNGGNKMEIIVNRNGRNRTTNMHAFWDQIIPEYYIKNYYKYNDTKIANNNLNVHQLVYIVLNKNMKIGCKVYPKTNYIKFESYFNENNLHELFDNYLFMMVNIMKIIYN
jgi:hypothetical protein